MSGEAPLGTAWDFRDDYEEFVRKQRARDNLKFWGLVALSLVLLGGLLVKEHLKSLHQEETRRNPGIATVNGESLTVHDYQHALHFSAGQQTLDRMILRTLVLQAARAEGVAVALEDVELPDQARTSPLRQELRRNLQAETCLRKLILKKVSVEELRGIHSTFKADLTRYDLAFKEGKNAPTEIRGLTRAVLETRLGTNVAGRIVRLKPGQESGPLISPRGPVEVTMLAVHDDFETLRPAVENIAVESRRAITLHSLFKTAEIDSPFKAESP